MKVCYFGTYNSEYSRNRILINGLRENRVEVLECRSAKKGIFKYFDLIKKHRIIKNNYDVMIVGFPGQQAMILAKFLTRKPIVFDVFVSIYDSMVFDRKLVKRLSFKSLYYWCLDKVSMELADLILFDTYEHIKYATKEFNISINKFVRIFVGADIDIFYPKNGLTQNGDFFKVLFFGMYIPLQGVKYIIEAAKLLEKEKDVIFEIIGDGQEKENAIKLAEILGVKNVIFTKSLPIEELADKIEMADVCLGIFGDTEKTKRVIPNKVYECLAMKKPVITADTLAERELFTDKDILFTKPANPESLSTAIMTIKRDKVLAQNQAKSGYNKFIKNATPQILGLELKQVISENYGK